MNYLDCLIMNSGLNAVNVTGMKARFSYAVARNKRLLEPIIKSLEEMVKPSDEMNKFTEERQALLKEHADKDENGDPIVQISMVNGQRRETFKIPGINNKDNKFTLEMDKLKKKYKKELDEQEAKEKGYENHLVVTVDQFVPITVDMKLVPDGLSQEAMDGVIFMIREEVEVSEKTKRLPGKKT